MFVETLRWLWVIFNPQDIVYYLFAASLLLIFFLCKKIILRIVLAIVFSLYLFFLVFPWDIWLLSPLEDQFPQPALDQPQYSAIVVLSGHELQERTMYRQQPQFSSSAERLIFAALLAQALPQLPLIISGTHPNEKGPSQSSISRDTLENLGIAPERILIDENSINTQQTFVFLSQYEIPPTQPFLVISSAFHLPRIAKLAKIFNVPIVMFPVDYRTSGTPNEKTATIQSKMENLSIALHEYLALYILYAFPNIATKTENIVQEDISLDLQKE